MLVLLEKCHIQFHADCVPSKPAHSFVLSKTFYFSLFSRYYKLYICIIVYKVTWVFLYSFIEHSIEHSIEHNVAKILDGVSSRKKQSCKNKKIWEINTK